MAENEDNDGNGTIMIDPTAGAGQNLLIQGVKLDVSGADGAVTVTLKVTAGDRTTLYGLTVPAPPW